MENDFPPEYHKFTMRLVDDHRRFDSIDPADAFADILEGISSDSSETVYFTIGSEETAVLIETLRKKGFLSESFPNATEFLELFAPGGKSWECSPRDPWHSLFWNSADSGIRREERIHPLLLRFLSKLYIDKEVRSNDGVSFWNGFPDGQSTFFPATGISPLQVEIHSRYKSQGGESRRMRAIAAALGLVAYYGDEELVEGNPWERRDDHQSKTSEETDEEFWESIFGKGVRPFEPRDARPPSKTDDTLGALREWTVDGEGDLVQLVEQWLASEGLADDYDDYLSDRDSYVHLYQKERNYYLNLPTLVEFLEGIQAFGISLEEKVEVWDATQLKQGQSE